MRTSNALSPVHRADGHLNDEAPANSKMCQAPVDPLLFGNFHCPWPEANESEHCLCSSDVDCPGQTSKVPLTDGKCKELSRRGPISRMGPWEL
eukprot:768249-Hanusia_phi.AAC.1